MFKPLNSVMKILKYEDASLMKSQTLFAYY